MFLITRLIFCGFLGAINAPAFAGPFQSQALSFSPETGLSNRLITPNGDNRNDSVVFTVSNPRDSSVSGTIFDLKGAKIADLVPGPAVPFSTTLVWDAKAGGQTVCSGVYVYVLSGEEKAFTGTLVVIR